MTRESKRSFVSDAVDLAANLRQQEFDEDIAAAAGIGRDMGLTAGELKGLFLLGTLVGVGWRMTVLGLRLGTLAGTLRITRTK